MDEQLQSHFESQIQLLKQMNAEQSADRKAQTAALERIAEALERRNSLAM